MSSPEILSSRNKGKTISMDIKRIGTGLFLHEMAWRPLGTDWCTDWHTVLKSIHFLLSCLVLIHQGQNQGYERTLYGRGFLSQSKNFLTIPTMHNCNRPLRKVMISTSLQVFRGQIINSRGAIQRIPKLSGYWAFRAPFQYSDIGSLCKNRHEPTPLIFLNLQECSIFSKM